MRKLTMAAVAAMIALSGQAMAETTAKSVTKVSADRVAAAKGQTNQQLLGLGLIPTLLIGAAIVTLVVIATDDDDKTTSP